MINTLAAVLGPMAVLAVIFGKRQLSAVIYRRRVIKLRAARRAAGLRNFGDW